MSDGGLPRARGRGVRPAAGGGRAAGRSAGTAARLQPVRHPRSAAGAGDGDAEGARDRARNLLPRAAAPAGVLRLSGASAGRLAGERVRGGSNPGAADLSRIDR